MIHGYSKEKIIKVARKIVPKSMILRTIEICCGYLVYRKMRWQFGKHTQLIIFRGATGDLYLQFLLLKAYLEKCKFEKYSIIGCCWNFNALADLFCYSNIYQFKKTEIVCLEAWYLFSSQSEKSISIPFFWPHSVWFNRCRVRLDDRFTFMDTYVWMSFGLEKNSRSIYKLPHFEKRDTESLRFLCDSMGVIKGKTVWIAPDANSITGFPPWFWNMLIHALQDKGYTVFMNCGEPNFYRAPSRILPYKACVPVLEYSGYFLGLRSGLCDIISTADCKKVILYPERQPAPDYGNHRSEAEFSSLVRMNLSDASPDLVELSTPLLQNITDDDSQLLTRSKSYFDAMQTLHDDILRYF